MQWPGRETEQYFKQLIHDDDIQVELHWLSTDYYIIVQFTEHLKAVQALKKFIDLAGGEKLPVHLNTENDASAHEEEAGYNTLMADINRELHQMITAQPKLKNIIYDAFIKHQIKFIFSNKMDVWIPLHNLSKVIKNLTLGCISSSDAAYLFLNKIGRYPSLRLHTLHLNGYDALANQKIFPRNEHLFASLNKLILSNCALEQKFLEKVINVSKNLKIMQLKRVTMTKNIQFSQTKIEDTSVERLELLDCQLPASFLFVFERMMYNLEELQLDNCVFTDLNLYPFLHRKEFSRLKKIEISRLTGFAMVKLAQFLDHFLTKIILNELTLTKTAINDDVVSIICAFRMLRKLKFDRIVSLNAGHLMQIAQTLPNLRELHVIQVPLITDADIAVLKNQRMNLNVTSDFV